MSGEGLIGADPGRDDLATEVIVRERAGVLAHARSVVRALEKWSLRGVYSADQRRDLQRILLNFADDIAIGLHVEGEGSPELRERMRALVKAANDAANQGEA